MPRLQATWIPTREVFFWTEIGPVEDAILRDLPSLNPEHGEAATRSLVFPGDRIRRRPVRGYGVRMDRAVSALAAMPVDIPASSSVWCWSRAALLALELGANQRVVPTTVGSEARWKVLVDRPADAERFRMIESALPPVSYSTPTRDRGPIRVQTPALALQGFLDASVDALYRQGSHPGPARGWVYEFSQALRGEDATFSPRAARYQGIPERIASWASGTRSTGLRLGIELGLPGDGEDGHFPLHLWLQSDRAPGEAIPAERAWEAGSALRLAGEEHPHPAYAVMRQLARAVRLFPPLGRALRGPRPRSLTWSADEAWRFLEHGVEALSEAGFRVGVPEEFQAAGRRRIRARMRIGAPHRPDGSLDLDGLLSFRWEVVLGDRVVEGPEFAALLERGEPLVKYQGEWVLLDPSELERLPEGLPQDGELPATEALRAVLVGEHDGVPVIADDRLELLIEALRDPPAAPLPTELDATLRPYQLQGYHWLTTLGRLGLGACLADDMGLGKTVQFIAHVLARRPSATGPALVVCPTSVMGNWIREVRRFAPTLSVLRYHGLAREADHIPEHDLVITSYGLLGRDQEELSAVEWDVVALDEAQAIKNPVSQRARAARRLQARHRVALTGTPVENRLDELWSIFEFLLPGLLGPRTRFRREVAVPVERFGDEEVARRLRLGVSPFLLRRVKSDPDVIADLPDKLEQKVYCPLTPEQADLYRSTVDDFMERISGTESIERRGLVLSMLTALKQVCNHPAHFLDEDGPLAGRSGKLERVVELLDTILELEERALVFTQYRAMGDLLQEHFAGLLGEDVPFLHGGTPAHRREEMVRSFQEDEDSAPLLLVSLRAGGTGLNLTRATHVIHYDRWWNPAVEDQATDRVYRIGQRRDVEVHKLVVQDTLEERIDEMLDDKRALAEQVVGSGERWVTELTDAELRVLVQLGEDAVVEEE